MLAPIEEHCIQNPRELSSPDPSALIASAGIKRRRSYTMSCSLPSPAAFHNRASIPQFELHIAANVTDISIYRYTLPTERKLGAFARFKSLYTKFETIRNEIFSMAGMLRCLPFVESREDEDVERNKMAIVAARAFLDNRQGDAELRTQDKVSSEQEKMSESTDHAHEAGVSVPPGTKDSKNSKRFSGGVTLWFSLLLASVGHAVFEYVSGVVEKMEKLEYE